jgi:RNA polymerase sigma factor (sigma-70 family)
MGETMASQKGSEDENLRLAAGLLGGDEGALEAILRAYGPPIQRALEEKYCRTLRVLTREDIEDVLSVALHRLWEARTRYDHTKATLRTLLYCIAENVARDVLRSGWQKVRLRERCPGQGLMEQLPDPCTVKPADEEKAERPPTKTEKDLQEVLSELPEVQRKIIVADAAGKDDVASSSFLADELSIAVGTVRVHRSRGMERIRTEMRKRGHEVP